QRLVRDRGRDSSITTSAPVRMALVSSCAMYFFRRVMYLWYRPWSTRRVTSTTTVFSILSETTVPISVRRPVLGCSEVMSVSSEREGEGPAPQHTESGGLDDSPR